MPLIVTVVLPDTSLMVPIVIVGVTGIEYVLSSAPCCLTSLGSLSPPIQRLALTTLARQHHRS
ncbi:hypothetical protein, partial [Vibrio parahaemolyticus]|uniref:hypothetical protein n=1 Tax=Vibrio parahaemolyticus TaxID=670 RepID=UPI001E35815C